MTDKHPPEPWQARHTPHRGGDDIWCIDWSGKQEEVAEIVHGKNTVERIVACVNACKGINPEAVPDLLESLRDAIAWLEDEVGEWCGDEASSPSAVELQRFKNALAKATGKEPT